MTDEEIALAYDKVALSIAAFERTQLFGQFNSKYDAYLSQCLTIGGTMDDCARRIGKQAQKASKSIFTREEWRGLQLFVGENDNDGLLEKGEGAMCAACHIAD